ncbi:hypothetical protein PJN92_29175, partial [Mycobacterium kansasii]
SFNAYGTCHLAEEPCKLVGGGTVANGSLEVVYDEHGGGTGPPTAVFLHKGIENWHIWRQLIARSNGKGRRNL